MRKFTDSLITTSLFFHNHGEELRSLIHKMDSRTHLSNGSISQQLLPNINTTISIIINITLRILETKVLMRKSTVSPTTTNPSSHNHGEEPRSLIQQTDS